MERERERDSAAARVGALLGGGDEVCGGRSYSSPNSPPRIRGHHTAISTAGDGTKTVLDPRIGYLPLVVPIIKPYIRSALPPGEDTVWYVPLGVLFDLLCVEPERPWNLTVYFIGYPGEILTPCEGEEAIKWSYINSLKEATYVINVNSKDIMNMPQADPLNLWQSLVKDALNLDNWDSVSYIDRAVEVHKEREIFGEEAPSNVNELEGSQKLTRLTEFQNHL